MHEFDKYIKHDLEEKYYIRYADDFIIIGPNKNNLSEILRKIKEFFNNDLNLELHPNKISIKTSTSGIDFLGWVNFPDHKILRKKTQNRALKKVNEINLPSYTGLLKHGNTFKLQSEISKFLLLHL